MPDSAVRPSAYEALTGPGRDAIVRRALIALGDAPCDPAMISIDRVHHRPGADTTVVFSVSCECIASDLAEAHDVLVVTTADVGERSVPVDADGVALRAWRHPHDPRLPELPQALAPDVARGWLVDAGADPGDAIVECELLTYRPLRRAVTRVTAGRRRWFVKLIRADRAPGLVRRHELLDAAGVGPRIAARPADGVLITEQVPGRSLASAVVAWHRHPDALPSPHEVFALLDRLPAGLMDLRRRPSWSERADFHGEAAASALGQDAGEIRAIAARIAEHVASAPAGPLVPTHGDLYEANAFVADGHFTRLIDVDSAGPGRRVDDLACLLGHLAVLPDLSPRHYPRAAEVSYAWASAFEEHVDPVALRARVAGVLLSLVAGTTPAHSLARLELCRSWLYRADHAR